jgi:hypothetical protein
VLHVQALPQGMTVLRTGKWAVTSSEMSDGDYPTYCAGMAYVTLTTTVIALRAAVREEPFFWIDDVYVTGKVSAVIRNIICLEFKTRLDD